MKEGGGKEVGGGGGWIRERERESLVKEEIINVRVLVHFLHSLDELFQTPLSSPPSEEEQIDGVPLSQPAPPQQLQSALHSLASHQKLLDDPFERYLLCLSDLQILVGKAEDDWKEVTRSGQSSLHLLDRFTLSVRIQRWVGCFYLRVQSLF